MICNCHTKAGAGELLAHDLLVQEIVFDDERGNRSTFSYFAVVVVQIAHRRRQLPLNVLPGLFLGQRPYFCSLSRAAIGPNIERES